MSKQRVAGLAVLVFLAGCAGEEPGKLTIDNARSAGLETDRQQLFDMIEAEDGWSGYWAGDRVELYQYERSSDVKRDFFEGVVAVSQEENHGWVEFCQQKNLIMLSKGKHACTRLETVTAGNPVE
ncbi:MAG: hypothetical protein CMN28_01990 [Salinisphaeraceae bacterium]|nr:hypothetical protein [Salinisphaeraceae bacterium]